MTKKPSSSIGRVAGSSAFPVVPPHKRWEYLVQKHDPMVDDTFEEWLNNRGERGWEVIKIGLVGITYFKREA